MKISRVINLILLIAPILAAIITISFLYFKKKTVRKSFNPIVIKSNIPKHNFTINFPELNKSDIYDLIRIEDGDPIIDDHFMVNAIKRLIEKMAPNYEVKVSYEIFTPKEAFINIEVNNQSKTYRIKLIKYKY